MIEIQKDPDPKFAETPVFWDRWEGGEMVGGFGMRKTQVARWPDNGEKVRKWRVRECPLRAREVAEACGLGLVDYFKIERGVVFAELGDIKAAVARWEGVSDD